VLCLDGFRAAAFADHGFLRLQFRQAVNDRPGILLKIGRLLVHARFDLRSLFAVAQIHSRSFTHGQTRIRPCGRSAPDSTTACFSRAVRCATIGSVRARPHNAPHVPRAKIFASGGAYALLHPRELLVRLRLDALAPARPSTPPEILRSMNLTHMRTRAQENYQ
jgi:hypothetical protein